MKLVGEACEKYNSLCDSNEKIPLVGIANWGSLESKGKAALSNSLVKTIFIKILSQSSRKNFLILKGRVE